MSDVERPRIQPEDCLALLRLDLEREGAALPVTDAARCERWFSAAADVLAQVPDRAQRMSWAVSLAQAVNGMQCPMAMFTDALLNAAVHREL